MTAQKGDSLFFLEDAGRSAIYFALSLVCFWIGLRTPAYIDIDGMGMAISFLLGIFCFYMGSRYLKRTYYRTKGRLIETLCYWQLKCRLEYLSPIRVWKVSRNVFPKQGGADIDILVERKNNTGDTTKIVIEIKTAQSDWGLNSVFTFRWSGKAKNALAQTLKVAEAAGSKAPVLWLPLCTTKFHAMRDGVLVVAGNATHLIRAIKKLDQA